MGLTELVDSHAVKTGLCVAGDEGKVRCLACAHRCEIVPGGRGICRMRFNRNGELFVPFGYVSSLACDPVEKKPFFHLLPGGNALSFGMLGCNFSCSFCQNSNISQSLRDTDAVSPIREVSPQELLASAASCDADIVVSTYNEPLITAEWAKAVFEEAGKKGLLRAFVSNGFAGPEVVEYMRPAIDAWKVDLKGFDDAKYRAVTGGRLAPVLETIKLIYAADIWLEIVTLVVPGFNDTQKELTAMAEFIASVSPEIPWHVTAFHPDYKMQDADSTSPELLERAANAGAAAGLQFVYEGNIPGSGRENTLCPACGELLVERRGFTARIAGLTPSGKTGGACKKCGKIIPGIFRVRK